MNEQADPFDDIRTLLERMPGPDTDAGDAARARETQLVKPAGSLGRLEEIATWVATWQGRGTPAITRPVVAIFAGSHGVAERGVSAYPASVNRQMVETFAAGGAAINQICANGDLGLKVFELALDMPCGDITAEPALAEADCAATIAYGMEAVAGGSDLLCLGEMGIGNTTAAAALCAGLFGGSGADWAGSGTGVDDAGYARKVEAVDQALACHAGELDDPLHALRRLGGREFSAICGAIIAARYERVPVILDGFPVTAAAAVLQKLKPRALDHCILGHLSGEQGHVQLAQELGMEPVLSLGMRLGEGTGAALAAGIVRAAVATHTGMATFETAGVSGPA
ncbi:nicotinate-nucleotide--dimethylbenzimidazole phosphoribosyltransferase [Tepidamorphus sp. 3E244]|uniref:nicotinate-nucleotide--dimethylbenzimidazole phosphoribosyltransferase n=1 Tax=Tepidamorphus sp. 3E244 TaxID=3385498 RepID=UPI0038FBF2A0